MKRVQRNRNTRKDTDAKANEFINDVQDAMDYNKVVSAVAFIKHETGEVSVVTSEGDAVEIMGLIETGKQFFFNDRWND